MSMAQGSESMSLIKSDLSKIDFDEVIKIDEEITNQYQFRFNVDLMRRDLTNKNPIVIIDTLGGSMEAAESMYKHIRIKLKGKKLVCLGVNTVASMGFNIMSRCDVKYSLYNTSYMMHDVYLILVQNCLMPTQIINLKFLRESLNKILPDINMFREINRKALNITRKEIDKISDAGDVSFKTPQLIEMKYLDDIVTIYQVD